MIRSLFSGVSGMKNHQVRMDTIGNNVANVNTTGFKSARCNFQDLISQDLRSPSAGDNGGTGTGGVNPGQVGLGMTVSSIANNMQQGAMQTTGRTLDLAIQGNGYFIINKTSGGSPFYTREGIFYMDNEGYLVNSNGYYVCDDSGTEIQLSSTPESVSTISISDTGLISVTDSSGSNTMQIGLATFPNDSGLKKSGQNLYEETTASGAATLDIPGTADTALENSRINSGYLEMSNVDLTDEFTGMIVTQRGYQANSRVITVSDTLLEELINLKR